MFNSTFHDYNTIIDLSWCIQTNVSVYFDTHLISYNNYFILNSHNVIFVRGGCSFKTVSLDGANDIV